MTYKARYRLSHQSGSSTLPAREASEMLVSKARQRARGGGDNLSLALVRVETLENVPRR